MSLILTKTAKTIAARKVPHFRAVIHGHFLSLFSSAGGGNQVCRPHFPSALHPWGLPPETKPMVPHAHGGWHTITPFSGASKTLSHPGSTGHHLGSSMHSSGIANTPASGNSLFSFPPTPPKDSTPDMGGANAQHQHPQAQHPHAGTAGQPTEYSPDTKPKDHSGAGSGMEGMLPPSSASPSYPTAHHMPTYPYTDYTSSALFHPANMFKAATLARVRTNKRSS